MQTFTVEIKNDDALKVLQDLQEKHHIEIRSSVDLDSPVFPGKPMKETEFKDFILKRENGPSISIKEAKAKWQKKRKQLLKAAQ